jgi:hypothetical protein
MPRHIQFSMALQLQDQRLLLEILLIGIATVFYHVVHGAELMNITFESYDGYKQGHSTGGTYVEAVARLVSAYTLVASVTHLSLQSLLLFYDPRSSILYFRETPISKTPPSPSDKVSKDIYTLDKAL